MGARFSNRARLDRKLKAMPRAVIEGAKQALGEQAQDIVDLQKRLVPVDHGDTRDSIKWAFGQARGLQFTKGGSLAGLTITARITAGEHGDGFQARWVEFGTAPHVNKGIFDGTMNPGIPPHPFFYPAYRAKRKGALAKSRAAMRKAARAVAAGKA